MDRDIIIFGAGQIGQMALSKYADRVDYFIDNDEKLQGSKISGIEIKSVIDGVKDIGQHMVVIASRCQSMMAEQLDQLGVSNYILYRGDSRTYYDTEELVINPYQNNRNRDVGEEEWNEITRTNYAIGVINDMVEQLQDKNVMFDHVEIETINRCNGNCGFCPVSKQNDPREYAKMSDELFSRIIDQLAEIDYSGKLALFSNNEPFLDPDILARHKYARKKLPLARMHLFTNGTLLTIERFVQLMNYLDELIIDNYHQELQLNKPCKEIVKYCKDHPELKSKVTIVLRKPQEILTSRGGEAPNRKKLVSYEKDRCILPYKQLIIRPDGKISLCCNDPMGRNTLGDLSKETILDAWNNQRFKTVRRALYEGRANWPHCKYCDVFNMG